VKILSVIFYLIYNSSNEISFTDPLDFQDLPSGQHVLDANNSMITVTFFIRNSADYEVTENIGLNLSFVGSPPDRVAINPDSAVINIVDESGNVWPTKKIPIGLFFGPPPPLPSSIF